MKKAILFDLDGSVMAGQSAGLVKKEETCAEIIRDVMSGAEKLLGQK